MKNLTSYILICISITTVFYSQLGCNKNEHETAITKIQKFQESAKKSASNNYQNETEQIDKLQAIWLCEAALNHNYVKPDTNLDSLTSKLISFTIPVTNKKVSFADIAKIYNNINDTLNKFNKAISIIDLYEQKDTTSKSNEIKLACRIIWGYGIKKQIRDCSEMYDFQFPLFTQTCYYSPANILIQNKVNNYLRLRPLNIMNADAYWVSVETIENIKPQAFVNTCRDNTYSPDWGENHCDYLLYRSDCCNLGLEEYTGPHIGMHNFHTTLTVDEMNFYTWGAIEIIKRKKPAGKEFRSCELTIDYLFGDHDYPCPNASIAHKLNITYGKCIYPWMEVEDTDGID